MNKKLNSRLVISLLLVFVVGAMLWFATPTKALNINLSGPASGAQGTQFTFTVQVNVESLDLLPVQSVQISIFKTDQATTYLNTYSGLPLATTPGEAQFNSVEQPNNPATISASAAANWGSGTDNRVAYDSTSGTPIPLDLGPGPSFGYGYAGSTFQGPTSITYSVKWTPPAAWPVGSYQVQASVAVSGTQNIVKLGNSFTISAASSGGSGGGGGGGFGGGSSGPAPTPGVNDVREKANSSGVFYVDTYPTSPDNSVILKIVGGTRGLNKDGMPLTEISILPTQNSPGAPAAGQALVLLYEMGPAGATFSNPVTLTMGYDPAKLPAGVSEANLYIAWFDTSNGKWTSLPSTVDTAKKSVSAQLSHFTTFGIFGTLSQPPTSTPAPTTTTSLPTTPPPPKPATFLLSKLDLSALEVSAGQNLSVDVTILNNGDLGGEYELRMSLNGTLLTTQPVYIAAHSAQTKTLVISASALPAGDYSVSVENLKASFVVKVPVGPVPSTSAAPAATATSAPSTAPVSSSPVEQSGGSVPILWITLWACIFIAVATAVTIVVTRHRAE